MLSFPPPFILEPSWQRILKEELEKSYLIELAAFIQREYLFSPKPVYPPQSLIFNAFYQTPFDKVKVLIIGQDPYHGPGQAHGLSFSVPEGTPPPPSLKNIFKEMEADLSIPKPSHGSLLSWAKQGVMLLNATLTVREGEPLSHHGRGWEKFTDAVVDALIARKEGVIFVLWGKSAQEKCRFLKNQNASHHHVLTAAHPSPLSAHNGFLGSRPFSKINQLLVEKGEPPIDWKLS